MQYRHSEIAEMEDRLYEVEVEEARRRTDVTFAKLMPVQLAGVVGLAMWLSQNTWEKTGGLHPRVWMALGFGGLITVMPAMLAFRRPGERLTRHVFAAAQMLMGSLLINLSGGRIEAHFFLFGGLALLAFYADTQVLVTAGAVVMAEHLARHFFLPQSMHAGVNSGFWPSLGRSLWPLYEGFFLYLSVQQSLRKMRRKAHREAELRINRQELLASQKALAASESENRELVERSPFGIYRSTPDGRVLMANPAMVETLGYGSMEELMAIDLEHPDSPNLSRAQFKSLIEEQGEVRNLEFKWKRRDGIVLLLRENARIVWESDGSILYYEGMLEDITERQQLHEQLVFRAHHDALTGLPNRLLLEDRVWQALARAERDGTIAALLCIDLDRFKQVNDSFGHHVGDVFLQEVVQRISGRLRSVDTFARVGGDEFVIVLGDLREASQASAIADDLLMILEPMMEIDGHSIQASVSIGIALFPEDGGGPEELQRRADQALYRAKAMGRGQHRRFTPEMDDETEEAVEIEVQLRKAIEQGGFELHYQPLVNRERTIVGLEALLRFRHPKLGLVPPIRFIPVAEQNGLIVPIGEWALCEACRQAAEWVREGLPVVPIAVNVSARQLGPDFVTAVAQALRETKLDPGLLELELTESCVMEDFEESGSIINRLKQLGVRIGVDDFGTGYSSLSYLNRLPIDVVKIDYSFIERIGEVGGTTPVVEAIVKLAQTLGMRTVAEGVETEEQFAILRGLGCDQMQGYLFAHPEGAEEARQRLEQGLGARC
jgi:diguanylate cyclase (GGDEF)-like protein/PAS domain S-box-containing protein